jgi:hypothetical protein
MSGSVAVYADAHDYDIDIGWIRRFPSLEYVWGSSQPDVDGWPTNGQVVTWRAYVKNWHTQAFQNVSFTWYFDYIPVSTGSVTLAPNSHTTLDYQWPWSFDRHELALVIDPDDAIPEFSETNNTVSVFTDAISVGFWVEQSVYDYFHKYQKDLGDGANSWEDWAQRHVSRWNRMFETAVYGDDTPNGVLDRIRLDNITIVQDGELPLNWGLPTNSPDRTNRTVDLQWGFVADQLDTGFYDNHTSRSDNNPFYFEGSLLHELGHARYLIDGYGFNVHDTPENPNVGLELDGYNIVDTAYMPRLAPWYDTVHKAEPQCYGLMGGNYTFVDHYSAMALNLIAGQRAVLGNYNAPGNIGIFRNDLPAENIITIHGQDGIPIPDATVSVFQARNASGWYGKRYTNFPDLVFMTDANGKVNVGRCPFDTDGTIEHTYGIANGVCILQVEKDGKIGFTFLESTRFNMEYWRGNTQSASYDLDVRMISRNLALDEVDPPNGFSTVSGAVDMKLLIGGMGIRGVSVNDIPVESSHGLYHLTYMLPQGGSILEIYSRNYAAIMREYIVYYRGNPHSIPPSSDQNALVYPSAGAEIEDEETALLWNPEMLTDHIGGTNLLISKISVVLSNTLEEVAVAGMNIPNPRGRFEWIPPQELVSQTNTYYLSFGLLGSYETTTNITFTTNPFQVIPEPGTLIITLLPLILITRHFKKT